MRWGRRIAIFSLVFGLARATYSDDRHTLPVYTVTDLGALPVHGADGSYAEVTRPSFATAINTRGDVAGVAFIPGEGCLGYLYRKGRAEDLGSLEAKARPTSQAHAISDNDDIAGYSSTGNANRAFLWQKGRIQDLGTLRADNTGYSCAYGVSRSGQVVGEASADGTGTFHAFLWEKGRMRDLGGPAPAFGSSARGINGAGQIVGYAAVGARGGPDAMLYLHAFLWDHGRQRDLETLTGVSSQANAINDAGEVVGVFTLDSGAIHTGNGGIQGGATFPGRHAFLWEHGRMKDMGTLGGCQSEALAINGRGDIVGASAPETPPDPTGRSYPAEHAFLYRQGRMLDLNNLLPKRSGWFLERANGINDRGEIVGNGSHDGTGHAFLLTPVAH